MSLLMVIAAYATAGIAALIAGTMLLRLWDGVDHRALLLEKVLRRQSDAAATLALASGSRDFARAVRRCVACRQTAQCRAWLASGAREGYESFCPNARYVRRMEELAS